MVYLLCILAITMVATGLSALTFGLPIIQNERGWAMVIAGSVGASGGAVLLGIALATQRLGRIASELVWIRDRLATIGEMTAEVAAPWAAAETAPAGEADPEPITPAPERVVVGQYESGGNQYKMYSDGSIDAQTATGLRRFNSLAELRAFVAGGGEQAT